MAEYRLADSQFRDLVEEYIALLRASGRLPSVNVEVKQHCNGSCGVFLTRSRMAHFEITDELLGGSEGVGAFQKLFDSRLAEALKDLQGD